MTDYASTRLCNLPVIQFPLFCVLALSILSVSSTEIGPIDPTATYHTFALDTTPLKCCGGFRASVAAESADLFLSSFSKAASSTAFTCASLRKCPGALLAAIHRRCPRQTLHRTLV
ncbi:hypothetical protein B0H14DRAFT_399987 [Mycena olivaceomarginata]|nr:hypothetical protein B0H14DRAFT_399987 [Mycena olivaceomarginata]